MIYINFTYITYIIDIIDISYVSTTSFTSSTSSTSASTTSSTSHISSTSSTSHHTHIMYINLNQLHLHLTHHLHILHQLQSASCASHTLSTSLIIKHGLQVPNVHISPTKRLEQELLVITQEFIHSSSPDLLAGRTGHCRLAVFVYSLQCIIYMATQPT